MRAALIIAALAGPGFAQELPSGLSAELREVLLEDVSGEAWARFRFVTPGIKDGAVSYFEAQNDFPVLCTDLALPYLAENAIEASKIMISLSDRFVEFGTSDPDATPACSAIHHENGDCIWEEL